MFPMNNSLLKADSTAPATLKAGSGPISPVLKSFQQIQSFFVLNG
jgi:hypothetical protein